MFRCYKCNGLHESISSPCPNSIDIYDPVVPPTIPVPRIAPLALTPRVESLEAEIEVQRSQIEVLTGEVRALRAMLMLYADDHK